MGTALPLPTPDGRPEGRVARKRNERTRRILATAAQVLAERGFWATGLDEIAERLDVTKASLYHYFDSKEQLVSACIEALAREATDALEGALADAPTTSNVDRLRLLVGRHLTYMLRERPESRVFAVEIDWPQAYHEQLKAVRRRHDRVFRDVVDAGVETGEFHVVSLEASLHCLWGALNHTPVWSRARRGRASLDGLIEDITDTVLMLVGVPARREQPSG